MRGVPGTGKDRRLITGREHHVATALHPPFVLTLLVGRSRQ